MNSHDLEVMCLNLGSGRTWGAWSFCPKYLNHNYHRTIPGNLPVAYNKVFKSLMGVPREFSASALFVC